jgi:hypothetical protein
MPETVAGVERFQFSTASSQWLYREPTKNKRNQYSETLDESKSIHAHLQTDCLNRRCGGDSGVVQGGVIRCDHPRKRGASGGT